MYHVADLSRGVTLTAGLVIGCTSVSWIAWEGVAWGVIVTRGTLLGTMWTHHAQ